MLIIILMKSMTVLKILNLLFKKKIKKMEGIKIIRIIKKIAEVKVKIMVLQIMKKYLILMMKKMKNK